MQKINNQLSKRKKMAAKRMAEVWRQPPADDGNAVTATATVTVTAMALAMAATMTMVEGNGFDEDD
jgi:hypothetical protein